ncbi:MAG TPA: GNAT family N-acetyltransferase [Thermodesulfobacteriota bacterium]
MSAAIRDATPAEAPALSAIALAAGRAWGYAEADLARWRSELTLAADLFLDGVVRVAQQGGEVRGFYALRPGRPRASLAHLWVCPGHWRRGLGRQLLADALEEARRRGALGLEVESDPHAEAFYLRDGARRVGAVPAPTSTDPARVLPRLWLDVARGRTPGGSRRGEARGGSAAAR